MDEFKGVVWSTAGKLPTDSGEEVLAIAWSGLYPKEAADPLSTPRLRRFSTGRANGHVVHSELRQLIVFAIHALTRDPPFSQIDLAICRSPLKHVNPEIQAKRVFRMHVATRSGGDLFCGGLADSLPQHQRLFRRVSSKWPIFRHFAASPHGAAAAALQERCRTRQVR